MSSTRLPLLRNLFSLATGETISKVLTFAAFAYLARVAGPAGYGYVEFAGSVLLVASLIVDQGLGPYGAREIAKAPERMPRLVAEIVTLRCILATVAGLAVLAVALSPGRPPAVTQLLCIYALSIIALPFLLQWVFQGQDRMRVVAITGVLRQFVFAAVLFALVRDATRIWGAAVAEVAGAAIAALYGIWVYRRAAGGLARRLSLRPAFAWRPVREGLPIGLSQLFWTARMYGATLILGFIAPAQDVGYFAGAMRILVALHAFVYLYYFNLLPSLARNWQRRDGTFARLTRSSLEIVAWAAALGGVGWVALAGLGAVLVYGPAFAPAGLALQVMAGVCMVALLSGHYRFGLIAAGRQGLEMLASAAGALVALALIPMGYARWGVAGAATALLAAETAVWALTWWWARTRLDLRGHAGALAKPLAAAALGLIVLAAPPVPAYGLRAALALLLVVLFALSADAAVRKRLLSAAASIAARPHGRAGAAG